MNAAAIIALVGAHGVRLTATDKHIVARPATKLTPALRDAICSHSAELLKLLTDDNRPASVDPYIEPFRHAPDRGRPLSDMPRNTRQDDGRSTPSDTDAQGGATASDQIADPDKPCLTCGDAQYWQLLGEP